MATARRDAGVSVAFPTAHLLVGCGVGEVAHAASGLPRLRAWAAGGTLAVLPDIDLVLPVRHGTWTHSILAVALVALASWLLMGGKWGLLTLAAYASHLFLDLLDGRGATNVYLAWPVLHRRATALADIFPDAPMALTRESLRAITVQTLIGALGLLLLWLLAQGILRGAGGRGDGG